MCASRTSAEAAATQYFHLHLISDSTGETLSAVAKAAIAQYAHIKAVKHMHPLVRSVGQLRKALLEVEKSPGIVLYTLINPKLSAELEAVCAQLGAPCVPILKPLMSLLEEYLGAPQTPTIGGQHSFDEAYFRRIDAVNFTLMHDDGQHPETIPQADIVLLGISRTTKTPTSIYLANRGYKTANIPMTTQTTLPLESSVLTEPFVVGLVASPERISTVRRKRAESLKSDELEDYVDREAIVQELEETRRLCAKWRWPVIDVTRRSIEETAAAILDLLERRRGG